MQKNYHEWSLNEKSGPVFQYQDNVQVSEAASERWYNGIITQVSDKLLVKPAGWNNGVEWDQIRETTQSKIYHCTEAMTVQHLTYTCTDPSIPDQDSRPNTLGVCIHCGEPKENHRTRGTTLTALDLSNNFLQAKKVRELLETFHAHNVCVRFTHTLDV